MNLPDDLRKKLEQVVAEVDPEYLAKYGSPLDENDPRHWLPSERKERGVSIEDRVAFLELDVETMQSALGQVLNWVADKQRREYEEKLAELMSNPEAAAEFLRSLIPASHGPDGDDGVAYAGSAGGTSPDEIIETVNGPIRADQIPGYKNDPEWSPSPDWADANCTCPAHVFSREQAGDPGQPDGPNGMYL